MNTALYLDTARMGTMCPAAQEACQAYFGLAASEGCSPCFETFLREGFDAWPASLRNRFGGLSAWPGLSRFDHYVGTATGLREMPKVLLAGRTANLMRLAARLLFRSCRRVLTTDLEWPGYLGTLENERARLNRSLIQVPLRAMILADRCSPQDAVRFILRTFGVEGCDGLFLSAVTYQGFRLPVRDIASAVVYASPPPVIVIDGAQAFGHCSPGPLLDQCDFFLTGAHKWLQAASPMGLGLCPHPRSKELIQRILADMIAAGELDDPLLTFSQQCKTDVTEAFGETVSLVPLFPCAGAIAALLREEGGPGGRFQRLLERAGQLESAAEGTSWQPVTPHEGFRSGMLLLKADCAETKRLSPTAVRQRFQEHGVALSAYGEGMIRLSAPPDGLSTEDLARLQAALINCA